MVLGRLVNDAALDDEAARLGLSAGDDAVRDQVMATPAFRGSDGEFDRETYTYALERIGLRPAEFEELLRRESARELVAAGVQAPATLPDTAALTVLDFLGEKRSFDWIRLDAGLLPEPVPPPTDAELAAEHDAHPPTATPARRPGRSPMRASRPTALAAEIEIPEDELRAAYDAAHRHLPDPRAPRRRPHRLRHRRGGRRRQGPARRRRDRLRRARRRARAQARGHRPGLRHRRQARRPRRATRSSARPAPASSARSRPRSDRRSTAINAILAASTTPFEEVRDRARADRALEEAQRRIHEDTAHVEDLIAGGATARGDRLRDRDQLGTLAFNSETTRRHRRRPGLPRGRARGGGRHRDRPVELDGGGLATLRVDAIEPPAVIPLAEIRDRVAADWTAARTADALAKLAVGYIGELERRPRLLRPRRAARPRRRRRRPADPRRHRRGRAPGARRRRLRREPRRRGHAPRRRRRDPRQARRGRAFDPAAGETPGPSTTSRQQYREQARDDVFALFTAALRGEAGVTREPVADRVDARPLPVACSSSPRSTRSPPRSARAGTRWSGPGWSPTSTPRSR